MPSHIPGFFTGTEMPTTGWWEALWPDPAGVIKAVGVGPNMRVIDLCCGDGWFTLEIARVTRQVVAIDIDATLLDAAQSRLVEAGATNGRFVAGDAYAIAKLVPEPADFIFMANAFHGVSDRPALAGAVRAALRPGGLFAIVNWHKRPREETPILGEPRGPASELRLSPEETIEAVESSGLKLANLIELPPYHYAAVFDRAP